MFELLAALRGAGWMVAVHNDYRAAGGEFHTFWLLTHPDGRYAKGEGVTDLAAIQECARQAREKGGGSL